MSIARDFETVAWGGPGGYFFPGPVTELLAHTRALEAMLKKHQYHSPGTGDDEVCVHCGSGDNGEDHLPTCELAKLLEGVE